MDSVQDNSFIMTLSDYAIPENKTTVDLLSASGGPISKTELYKLILYK